MKLVSSFFTVSCIASVLIFCMWLDYRNYSFKSEEYRLDSYEWDNFEESIDFESTYKSSEFEINDIEAEREELIEEENNLLEDKNIKNEDDVLFELVISSINLKRRVYNIDSSLNNVDKNVEILDSSNIGKKLFYLASHSGGGEASYFDCLIYLEVGDIIWLYGDDFKLGFVVSDMFYIQKNGYFEVSYGIEGNVLFLITCSLEYVGKQLIVKADLVYGL